MKSQINPVRADAPAGDAPATMLQVSNVCVHFGGIAALDAVSFSTVEGSITGLIGPN